MLRRFKKKAIGETTKYVEHIKATITKNHDVIAEEVDISITIITTVLDAKKTRSYAVGNFALPYDADTMQRVIQLTSEHPLLKLFTRDGWSAEIWFTDYQHIWGFISVEFLFDGLVKFKKKYLRPR